MNTTKFVIFAKNTVQGSEPVALTAYVHKSQAEKKLEKIQTELREAHVDFMEYWIEERDVFGGKIK